jgi:hypothetical protein
MEPNSKDCKKRLERYLEARLERFYLGARILCNSDCFLFATFVSFETVENMK